MTHLTHFDTVDTGQENHYQKIDIPPKAECWSIFILSCARRVRPLIRRAKRAACFAHYLEYGVGTLNNERPMWGAVCCIPRLQ